MKTKNKFWFDRYRNGHNKDNAQGTSSINNSDLKKLIVSYFRTNLGTCSLALKGYKVYIKTYQRIIVH